MRELKEEMEQTINLAELSINTLDRCLFIDHAVILETLQP